jgi:hypothetical protein
MATIHKAKIGSVASLAAGATYTFQWNNPPWDTVLDYFAYPTPPTPSGPHGATSGEVAVTRVRCFWKRDNYGDDKKYVSIEVRNTGSLTTGFDLYQSWID